MVKKFFIILLSITLLLSIPYVYPENIKRFNVAVSIQSLGGIIKDAYGDVVNITYILPEGAEPHNYQVTPDKIESLSNADIFVFTGHFSFEYTLMKAYPDKPTIYLNLRTGYYGKYKITLLPYPGKKLSEGYNPHGYWLYPYNAIKIAAAFRDILDKIDPIDSRYYNTLYENFRDKVNSIIKMYRDVSIKYGLEYSHVILGFPAEEYIVAPLNMSIVDIIVRGPGQVITPNEVDKDIKILSNYTNNLIIASDIAVNMAVGNLIRSISSKVSARVIYVDVIGFNFDSYIALMYYNLGRIAGGYLTNTYRKSGSNDEYNKILMIFIVLLIVIVVVEALYIYMLSKVY